LALSELIGAQVQAGFRTFSEAIPLLRTQGFASGMYFCISNADPHNTGSLRGNIGSLRTPVREK